MDIINKKYLYFLISIIVIIPGIISLFFFGLKLSIDFTGGSRLTYQVAGDKQQETSKELVNLIKNNGIEAISIQKSGDNVYIIRTKPLEQKTYQNIKEEITGSIKDSKELSFETIGPTIGGETTINALKAIVLASILIVIYIAWSFRKVPKPASSLRFGFCAIIALLHDVLVVVGIFSILGHFWQVEVDSLFVTALLTVVGFSVHDTIVVFDRIRENLRRMAGSKFSVIVNDSILQTLGRSLNTSLTVLLVLFSLLLFGGESIRWFVVALLIGVASGTYSSIFNAAPLLVVWHEWREKSVTR